MKLLLLKGEKRGTVCIWKQCRYQVCWKTNAFCSSTHSCILFVWQQRSQISYRSRSLQWLACASTEQTTAVLASQFKQGCCPVPCRNQRALQLLVPRGVARALLSKVLVSWDGLCAEAGWSWYRGSPQQHSQEMAAGRKAQSVNPSPVSNPCQASWRRSLPSGCGRLGGGKYGHRNLLGHVCPPSLTDGILIGFLKKNPTCKPTRVPPASYVTPFADSVLCQTTAFNFSLGKSRGSTYPRLWPLDLTFVRGVVHTVKACRSISVLLWTSHMFFTDWWMN